MEILTAAELIDAFGDEEQAVLVYDTRTVPVVSSRYIVDRLPLDTLAALPEEVSLGLVENPVLMSVRPRHNRPMKPSDPLAEPLRQAALGADSVMTAALVAAAYDDHDPHTRLVDVATSAVAAGTDRMAIVRACEAACWEIRTRAGRARDYDDPAEDHVLDLMDRLTGWCHPDCRI